LSLPLYRAEPPGQTLDDPAYGPRRPAKCAATPRFLLSLYEITRDGKSKRPAFRDPLFDPCTAIESARPELGNLYNLNRETLHS